MYFPVHQYQEESLSDRHRAFASRTVQGGRLKLLKSRPLFLHRFPSHIPQLSQSSVVVSKPFPWPVGLPPSVSAIASSTIASISSFEMSSPISRPIFLIHRATLAGSFSFKPPHFDGSARLSSRLSSDRRTLTREISRDIRRLLQCLQMGSKDLSIERMRKSETLPHVSHRNSYIGITSPRRKPPLGPKMRALFILSSHLRISQAPTC